MSRFRWIKQIMIKNAENAWLSHAYIQKPTDIPGINKSPSELLNTRKYRTNLPMIDIHSKGKWEWNWKVVRQMTKQTHIRERVAQNTSGYAECYMNKNPDSEQGQARPKWCKGTIKDRKEPRKYEILSQIIDNRIVTRSRHHIKGYFTCSERVSKAPDRLIENWSTLWRPLWVRRSSQTVAILIEIYMYL